MNTPASAASSAVPLMASLMGWLILFALLAVAFGVRYLAFKAWQNGATPNGSSGSIAIGEQRREPRL